MTVIVGVDWETSEDRTVYACAPTCGFSCFDPQQMAEHIASHFEEGYMAGQSGNRIDVARRVFAAHPEIDRMDEEARGRAVDYLAIELNALEKERRTVGAATADPWGRKARQRRDSEDPASGFNKNTDGLTFLRADGRFEIIDCISGANGEATWDHAGIFSQGENGYWAPPDPVEPVEERPNPGPVPRPAPVPTPPARPEYALDYGETLALTKKIADTLGKKGSRYRDNYAAIGEVIGHLMIKVEREGYSVEAAIDNASRRARGEEAE